MTADREPGRFGFLWYSVTHWPYRNFYTPEFLAPKATAPDQRERKAMSIRGFLSGARDEETEMQYPSSLTEIFRPRKAEVMWATLEEANEVIIGHYAEMEEADRAYERYADKCELGIQKGNPPDSRALDTEISRFSEQYPEITDPERGQAEVSEQHAPRDEAYQAHIDETGFDPDGECAAESGYQPDEPPNPYEQWPCPAACWPQREAGA